MLISGSYFMEEDAVGPEKAIDWGHHSSPCPSFGDPVPLSFGQVGNGLSRLLRVAPERKKTPTECHEL